MKYYMILSAQNSSNAQNVDRGKALILRFSNHCFPRMWSRRCSLYVWCLRQVSIVSMGQVLKSKVLLAQRCSSRHFCFSQYCSHKDTKMAVERKVQVLNLKYKKGACVILFFYFSFRLLRVCVSTMTLCRQCISYGIFSIELALILPGDVLKSEQCCSANFERTGRSTGKQYFSGRILMA